MVSWLVEEEIKKKKKNLKKRKYNKTMLYLKYTLYFSSKEQAKLRGQIRLRTLDFLKLWALLYNHLGLLLFWISESLPSC